MKEYCSRLGDLDEKLDKVILEIEKMKKERVLMKKFLMEWKHDWMEQSHKIQEIKTEYVERLPELSNTDIDQLIEEQKNEIRKHNGKLLVTVHLFLECYFFHFVRDKSYLGKITSLINSSVFVLQ